VESGLFALLETALRLHAETDGALDLTATPLWEAWGFARRQGAVPDAERLRQALALVGSRWIELDAEHRTIRFRKPGVRLSLGSIGKGHALDACGARLRAAGIDDFLLHGGNSSVLAAGCPRSGRGTSAPALAAGWEVGIVHPLRPNRRLGTLLLTGRALGTSGAWAQSFVHEGRRYGHILDPRTGQPADGVLSATALAPTAAEADALATAFFVLGPDGAADYCERHPGIAAVLACPIRRQGGLEIRTAGLEQGEFRAAE
jgi:thiamine biosynthesis lipoprotein